MDMYVDSQLIRNERLKRAWSQEHLAHVTGLGLRTVQRIENGGNASLETVKALAAVLEIPVGSLLIEASVQPVAILQPAVNSRFRLFKPWPVFAAGCAVTLIALGSLFNMQGALAQRVAMDLDVTLNAEEQSIGPVSTSNGSPISLEFKEQLRVMLVPTITENGFVRLNAEIYAIGAGDPRLIARPSVQTGNGTPAMFRVGDNAGFDGDDAGMMLEILVTPTIE